MSKRINDHVRDLEDGKRVNDRELARALQATKKTHGRDSMINDLAALLEAHKKGKKA